MTVRVAPKRPTCVRRRAGSGLAPALALLVCAACGLPTAGGVRVDQQVPDRTVDGPEIRKLPPGPLPGQSPEQAVQGFLEAGAAAPDGAHALAREFLAPGTQWDDGGVTTVYDATTLRMHLTPERLSASGAGATGATGATVTLTADAVALLGPDGGIRPSGRSLRLVLRLVRHENAWQIASLPPGVVMTPRDLSRGYSSAVLWIANPRGVLAPYPVAVAGEQTARPGAVVRALLARLAPASATGGAATGGAAVPGAGAIGLVGSVVLDGRTADVGLSRGAYGLDPAARRLLLAEVAGSLGSLPTVESVRVLSDGRLLPGGELPAGVPADLVPRSVGPGLAVGAGGLLQLRDTGGRVTVRLVARSAGQGTSQAVAAEPSPDSQRLAVLARGGVLSTGALTPVPGIGPLQVRIPDAVAAAGWLPDGTLLASPAGSPQLLAIPPAGATRRVDGVSPTGPVAALAVDPTGTRVAVAVGSPGRARLWLADVGTTAGGLALSGWEPASAQLDAVTALAWADPLSIVVGVDVQHGRPGLVELKLTAPGAPVPLAADGLPDGAVEGIAAAPGRPLVVGTGGRLWQQAGGRWQALGAGSAPAWPG